MICIDQGALEIFSFRVDPRTGLVPVLKKLQKQVDGIGGALAAEMCYSFGLVDLVLLIEGDLPDQYLPIVEGTRFYQNLRCFRFRGQPAIVGGESKHPFRVLQCFRLNHELTRSIGYRRSIEVAILKLVESQQIHKQKLHFTAYGTLGWAELIVFVSSESFVDLMNWLRYSRWLQDETSKQNLFDSTFSVPMMRCRLAGNEILVDGEMPVDAVSAFVFVGCNASGYVKLRASIEAILKPFRFSLRDSVGKSDIAVNVESIPLRSLCECLLSIQRLGGQGLLHVETHLQSVN